MTTATVVRKTGMELAALIADFDKTVGANADKSSVTEFIDTGYGPLNEIMSGRRDGGLPFGRLIEMFGESSTGKTALATQWMIQAQNMGGVAGFIDWERSFSEEMAVDMGLYTGAPYWMYKKPKTWEEGNMEALRYAKFVRDSKLISPEAPILIVLDSIASAIPKSVSEKGIDEYTMNDTTALARVTSTTLKNVAQFVEEYNATFLYLNQMRLKPGIVYGDPRCLRGDTMIPFVDGTTAAIEDVVKERIDKQVWSYNEESGEIEPRSIIGWHDNGSIKNTGKNFLHIRAKTPETANGVSAITVTNDHKVLVSGKGWVNAEEVKVGDKMLTRSRVSFTGDGMEFLRGVLAGDAHVAKSKNRQGAGVILTDKNDPAYAAWKAQVLSGAIQFTTITLKGGYIRHTSAHAAEIAYMASAARDPVALFGGYMSAMQLALLVQDDGFFDTSGRKGRYMISFKRFKGNSKKLNAIGDMFEKLGFSYSIRYGQGRIDFDTTDSRKIAEMIAKYVHPSMERKLPEDLRGLFQDIVLTRVNESVTTQAEVVEVRQAGKKLMTRMYDITVDGNHNFLAGNSLNGLVVHNCTPGGKAMEFYATVRLALGRTKLTEGTGADKEFIGQKISIQCMKSKLTKPFQECNLRMIFNDDGSVKFDTTTSLLEYLIENSLIDYSKPRVTWTDGKKYFVKELAAKIDAEGLQSELIAKLPI